MSESDNETDLAMFIGHTVLDAIRYRKQAIELMRDNEKLRHDITVLRKNKTQQEKL